MRTGGRLGTLAQVFAVCGSFFQLAIDERLTEVDTALLGGSMALRFAAVDLAPNRGLAQLRSRWKSIAPSQGASMQEIRFYRANEKPYGALSNLYKREIVFEGVLYPTSEHAYQAGKPRKEAVRDWILSAPSPALVAMAAHGLYWWDIRPGWSKVKFARMKEILFAKFTQHEDLRELLLSTGDARLVESATVDNEVNRTWGEVNGKGKNMLGVLLMEVREELRLTQPRIPSRKPEKEAAI